jgi:sec-independent protein translocase protein TatA
MPMPLGFVEWLGTQEMLIIGILAVLLFGQRLPEVGRTVGKKLMEFKKSVQGIQEEFTSLASTTEETLNRASPVVEDHEEATAPKFVPPPAEQEYDEDRMAKK